MQTNEALAAVLVLARLNQGSAGLQTHQDQAQYQKCPHLSGLCPTHCHGHKYFHFKIYFWQ